MGSGFGYANDKLVHGYDFNCLTVMLTNWQKTVLNDSFYDKTVVELYPIFSWAKRIVMPHEILNVYLNFKHNDLRRILFLIYKVNRTLFISSDHIINLLSVDADILVTYRIDERESDDIVFFFRRQPHIHLSKGGYESTQLSENEDVWSSYNLYTYFIRLSL